MSACAGILPYKNPVFQFIFMSWRVSPNNSIEKLIPFCRLQKSKKYPCNNFLVLQNVSNRLLRSCCEIVLVQTWNNLDSIPFFSLSILFSPFKMLDGWLLLLEAFLFRGKALRESAELFGFFFSTTTIFYFSNKTDGILCFHLKVNALIFKTFLRQ